jgi:hypothetical protein
MTRTVRRIALMALMSALVLVMSGHETRADDGPYPGLPPAETTPGYATSQWVGLAQGGVARVDRGRQWVSVPMQAVAVNNRIALGPGQEPGELSRNTTRNLVYFVAPSGVQPAYGVTRFTVRTVAFGTIPVVATVQTGQLRTSAGLPVPLVVEATDIFYATGPSGRRERFYSDTHVDGMLTSEVVQLSVDGVDVGLEPGCRSASPGALELLGRGTWQRAPGVDTLRPWQSGHFVPFNGGLLTGTLDIPPFVDCRTGSGDDLAPLLTAAVSGPGNPVRLHVGTVGGCLNPHPDLGTGPPPPGANTLEAANCRPQLTPPALEIPDEN